MLGLTLTFDSAVNATKLRLVGAQAATSCATILNTASVALLGTALGYSVLHTFTQHRDIENHSFSTQPNPTQPNPTQPNPMHIKCTGTGATCTWIGEKTFKATFGTGSQVNTGTTLTTLASKSTCFACWLYVFLAYFPFIHSSFFILHFSFFIFHSPVVQN